MIGIYPLFLIGSIQEEGFFMCKRIVPLLFPLCSSPRVVLQSPGDDDMIYNG